MKTDPPVPRATSKIKRDRVILLRLSEREETVAQELADHFGVSRQNAIRTVLTLFHRRLILEPRLEEGAGARQRAEEQELLLRLRQIRNERVDALTTALIPSLNGQPRLAPGARFNESEAFQILEAHAHEQAREEARPKAKPRRIRRRNQGGK